MATWWQLIRTFIRLSLLNETMYRANFFLQIFQSLFNLATTLILLQTIFSYTTILGGWHETDLLTLMGVYFLIGGCINFMVQPSLGRFMRDVRQGALDYTLLKPVDAQLLVSMQQVEIWRLVDILLGAILIVIAVVLNGLRIGWVESLGFAIMLLAGGAIIYSFLFFLSALVFWYIRIENILLIFQSAYETGRWPITIYPGWLRIILTFIIPIAFAITLPTQALLGQLSWDTVAGTLTLALVLLVGTRIFWRFGVRHYTGASS